MKAGGTNQPPGSHQPKKGSPVRVVGGGATGSRVQFYCIFCSNKKPLVPSLLAQHLHTTAEQLACPSPSPQRWDEGCGGSKASQGDGSPPPPPPPRLWG